MRCITETNSGHDTNTFPSVQFSSVQSLSRVGTLRPHELQHARPPCPSPTPGYVVYSDIFYLNLFL